MTTENLLPEITALAKELNGTEFVFTAKKGQVRPGRSRQLKCLLLVDPTKGLTAKPIYKPVSKIPELDYVFCVRSNTLPLHQDQRILLGFLRNIARHFRFSDRMEISYDNLMLWISAVYPEAKVGRGKGNCPIS